MPEVVLDKVVDEKRRVHEQNERSMKMNSLTDEIMYCVKQAMRAFNVLWLPWDILIERTGTNRLRIVAWLPENVTLPTGYQKPKTGIAFYHSEEKPINSFMDVNFFPIARELAKEITKRYRGES